MTIISVNGSVLGFDTNCLINSAVTVSIFGFAVGFGRFLNKNRGSRFGFYGSRF